MKTLAARPAYGQQETAQERYSVRSAGAGSGRTSADIVSAIAAPGSLATGNGGERKGRILPAVSWEDNANGRYTGP